jgi:mRNA interferase RelE/StbE
MLAIDLSRQAAAFLGAIPAKHGRQIVERIEALATDPASLPHEELRGYAPIRRLRSGEYRVIFQIEGEQLLILLIGRRNDDEVYKALERRLRR